VDANDVAVVAIASNVDGVAQCRRPDAAHAAQTTTAAASLALKTADRDVEAGVADSIFDVFAETETETENGPTAAAVGCRKRSRRNDAITNDIVGPSNGRLGLHGPRDKCVELSDLLRRTTPSSSHTRCAGASLWPVVPQSRRTRALEPDALKKGTGIWLRDCLGPRQQFHDRCGPEPLIRD
jgi:hypothetical protein